MLMTLLSRNPEGARSTALNTLLVALATLLAALLLAVQLKADMWVKEFLSVLISLDFGVFLFAYLFLLIKDRDALRSEPFALSKMAMEKSLTGDTLSGFQMIARSSGSQPQTGGTEVEGGAE
jgi:hypothetical protein